MKKILYIPFLMLASLSFFGCGSKPQPVQLTLISEWGSFSEEYPTPKLVLNAIKSQKLKDVSGLTDPIPLFPEVHTFIGWSTDHAGLNMVNKEYQIDTNTTLYAQYEVNEDLDTTYIVYNYNTPEASKVPDRDVVKFLYQCDGELTQDDIEISNFEKDKYIFEGGIYDPNPNYRYVKIDFKEKAVTTAKPCVIKIKNKIINNFRLSSGNATDNLYASGNAYITAVLLADGISTVGEGAFYNCSWLMAVHLPNTVHRIDPWAFGLCYSLNFLEVPEDLTDIGDNAFYGCATMEHVYFNQKITTIGQDAFLACASLQEIHLPDSVTALGKEAFRFCLLNKDLKIGKGLSAIPDFCFSENYYLSTLTIPNTVNTLGTACFQYCDSLTEVTFEDGGIDITKQEQMDAPFQYCISLTKVKLANRVKALGRQMFAHTMIYELDLSGCDFIPYGKTNPIGQDTPLNYGYGKIVVRNDLVDKYKEADGWSKFKDIIVG